MTSKRLTTQCYYYSYFQKKKLLKSLSKYQAAVKYGVKNKFKYSRQLYLFFSKIFRTLKQTV